MTRRLPQASPEELAWLSRHVETQARALADRVLDQALPAEEIARLTQELDWLIQIEAKRRNESTGEPISLARQPVTLRFRTYTGQTLTVRDHGCALFTSAIAEGWVGAPRDPAVGELLAATQQVIETLRHNWYAQYHRRALSLHEQAKTRDKPRQRLTTLEKRTGLADKHAAAKAVRKKLLASIKAMQREDRLCTNQKPLRWAERLANTPEYPVGADKIRAALPTKHCPWAPV